ncbi:MAG: phage tail tape measure protein [Lachnospiraceae bacterium]|nr:phage tail tape measure protein [Lachnospiraceae bacterium]
MGLLENFASSGFKKKIAGMNIGAKYWVISGAVISAVGAASYVVVKKAATFDNAMSNVAALTGAAGKDLVELRDLAREIGKTTRFSAVEMAEEMTHMALEGWKAKDIIAASWGVIHLALLSGSELSEISDIVRNASLKQYGLTAEDYDHFADVLAATYKSEHANVSLMCEALLCCAASADSRDFLLEDIVGAIGLLSKEGITGSEAGEALTTILSLTNEEVKICSPSIGEVAVATTDEDGSARRFKSIIMDCRKVFSSLSESEKEKAAEDLLGEDKKTVFLVLMNVPEEEINRLSEAIAHCKGMALGVSTAIQDNLYDQLLILKSQLKDMAISFGDLLMPMFRKGVGLIQRFVSFLDTTPLYVRRMIVIIAYLAAMTGPVLMILHYLWK